MHKVKSHKDDILAACFMDILEFRLRREILRSIFAVIFERAVRHDAANHVLAEIFKQKVVEFLCTFGRFGCNRFR